MAVQRMDTAETVIGENSYFEGRFSVKGTIRIDGKYEGAYLEVDQVYIGVKGRVKTNIKASNVVVEGIVVGNIHATTRILLLPTSRILGDIKTPELIIQNGVILEGRCTISNDVAAKASELITKMYES
ncbi:MAG: polymer-forming cytoskeletal protein [Spirochaetes bacterium]|nr:polymer-forming cytoskeletal protein [Spirochaetota bacterium]